MGFSEMVRFILRARGTSDSEFSHLMGWNRGATSTFFKSKSRDPKITTAVKVCQVLGLNIDDVTLVLDGKIPIEFLVKSSGHDDASVSGETVPGLANQKTPGDPDTFYIGDEVVRLLSEKGLTQADLSRGTRLSSSYVSQLVTGGIRCVSFDKAKAIASFFGVPLSVLCGNPYPNTAHKQGVPSGTRPGGSIEELSPSELALVASFRSLDNGGRHVLLCVAEDMRLSKRHESKAK